MSVKITALEAENVKRIYNSMTALQCVMGYPRGWGDHSPHPPGTLPITLAADTKKENEVRNDHTVFYPYASAHHYP